MVTVSLISFQASSPRWSFKHVSSILAALPHTLITDNGSQFTSELFKGFARKYEFYHNASKLGPNSLTSTSLFPHSQSTTVGHGGHRELKMWPQNPLSKWREDFPRRVRGQIVLFCYTNAKNLHPWPCLVSSYCCNGLRRKKLENFCFLAIPNLVLFCMFNSREQAVVCRGTVKSTCT